MSKATRHLARIAEWVLLVGGLAMLAYWSASVIDAHLYQRAKTQELLQTIHSRVPGPVARRRLRDGELIGRIEIPRLALSAIFIEGDSTDDLKRAAGHIPGTSLPGRPGNIAIAAHRDTFFRALRSIRANDVILVTTPEGAFTYHVISTEIVRPDETRVLSPTKIETLTLVTCYPFSFAGHAPRRFIVHAARYPPSFESSSPLSIRILANKKVDESALPH